MTKPRDRAALATGLGLLISALLVACAPSPEQLSEDRTKILASYLQAEQAAMADVLAQTATYTSADVTGEFEGNSGGERFPGVVVTFTYTYREPVEFGDPNAPKPSWVMPRPSWAPPLVPWAELESMKAALINLCHSTVIPSMRDAGLEGALTVGYIYLNPGPGRTESWSASCSSDGL